MKEIQLTKGAVTIVDDEDYELLTKWKWHLQTAGYACNKGGVGKGTVYMHRLILDCPDDMIVDHIDGNRLNNKRENLRIVTYSQNHMNRKVKRKNCTSKFKGVSYDANRGKWRSYIKLDGKFIHLGEFNTEMEAALTYDKAASERFGEYSSLNF